MQQQQTLAQSPSQAEDELGLVMELSEKDILFEKKKVRSSDIRLCFVEVFVLKPHFSW